MRAGRAPAADRNLNGPHGRRARTAASRGAKAATHGTTAIPPRQIGKFPEPTRLRRVASGIRKPPREPMMPTVEATLRSHPARPAHPDAISRCIENCFSCAGNCTACADACLSERDIEALLACIRQNHDCTAICLATGSVVARSKAGSSRQVLEAQLSVCTAACRACADECRRHAPALPRVRTGLRGLRPGLHGDAGCAARSGVMARGARFARVARRQSSRPSAASSE